MSVYVYTRSWLRSRRSERKTREGVDESKGQEARGPQIGKDEEKGAG